MDIDAALAEGFPEPASENVEEVETAAPVEETVKAEVPAEPTEPEVEAAPEEEDLSAKLALLEKRLTDQESFIGRQKNEIGELRTLKEQYEELQQQVSRQPLPPPVGQPEWLDSAEMDNPYQARQLVLWAAENQPHHYRSALSAWFDADPASASEFQTEVALAQQRTELEEQYKPLLEVPKRLEAEDADKANSQAFTEAWESTNSQYPEFKNFADELLAEAQNVPEFHNILISQEYGAEAKQRILETLFLAKQARRSQAEAIAAVQTKEAADAAVSKAKVGSATSTAGTRAPQQKSPFGNFLEGAFAEYGKIPPS